MAYDDPNQSSKSRVPTINSNIALSSIHKGWSAWTILTLTFSRVLKAAVLVDLDSDIIDWQQDLGKQRHFVDVLQ